MRSLLAAIALSGGGAALLSTLAIDYMNPAGFWAFIGTQGIGFVLVLLAATLTYNSVRQKMGWGALVAASAGWVICWSWFLHLGLFIPIPLVFWAGGASVGYLAATFILGAGGDDIGAAVTGVLALGSMLSTAVMAVNPVFASDFNYIPFGAGALLAGIVLGFSALRTRGSAAAR